jgi:hypothetical protein
MVWEERPVKPSAQPTLVRTQHLPPPAETVQSEYRLLAGTCISRFGAVCRLQCMTTDAFTIFFLTATDRTLAVRVAWLPAGVLMRKALLAGGAWCFWLSCRAVRARAREGGGAGSGRGFGWPGRAGGVLGAMGSGLIPARLHPVAAGWLR